MNARTNIKAPVVEARTERAAVPATSPARAVQPGPRIYNLFPLLVGTVAAWKAELPRIAAMNFDWVYLNPFHEAGFSGSLYAVKDVTKLDPRFRDPDAGSDDDQIRSFVEEAQRHGLKVMADLVINHTSKDAVLASEHPEVFVRNMWGELESPYAVDPDDPTKRTVWGDLAELDYGTDSARAFLLEYWDAYVARMQGLGIGGFRCDAAYKVPPEVWAPLIRNAKGRDAGCLFAAETLGCTFDEAVATAKAGFDYLFNSFAWWDFKKSWAMEAQEKTRLLAPSIAFPENHDMERVAAQIPDEASRDAIENELVMRYALAAFFSSGVLMPIGYETGARRKVHVVETTPEHREGDSAVDISARIAEINRLKAELATANLEGAESKISAADAPYLALLRLDAGHAMAANEAILIVANPGRTMVTVDPGALLARTGGMLGPFIDRTPGLVPLVFDPCCPVMLGPHEVRILVAERARVPAAAPGVAPEGEGRVVIETVWPELDGGRTPVKRVVGEAVEVRADIFSDGHDKIAAEILYRPADEEEWRRAPMRFVDNDRWAGSFPIDRNTRYLFTIEGWRDPFASWLHEIHAKQKAGVDVSLETIEGVQIAEAAARNAENSPDGPAMWAIMDRIAAAEGNAAARLAILLDEHNAALIGRHAERVNLSRYDREMVVIADRLAAQFSAWYELFPRSTSHDPNRHGTFDDVIAHL
ncbi:MAG: hypothetical protein JWQ36_1231, partial [Enterovirga sp.]|nr:hypothetical protein [Enterovirga sp.]